MTILTAIGEAIVTDVLTKRVVDAFSTPWGNVNRNLYGPLLSASSGLALDAKNLAKGIPGIDPADWGEGYGSPATNEPGNADGSPVQVGVCTDLQGNPIPCDPEGGGSAATGQDGILGGLGWGTGGSLWAQIQRFIVRAGLVGIGAVLIIIALNAMAKGNKPPAIEITLKPPVKGKGGNGSASQ